MNLPRGIKRPDGSLRKQMGFKPVTGTLEVETAMAARAATRPEAVAAVLDICLADTDGSNALELASGDARFLMAKLARHFGHAQQWMTATCGSCDGLFDFEIDLDNLPAPQSIVDMQEFAKVTTSQGFVNIRAPTLHDQIEVARNAGDDESFGLLERLVLNSVVDLQALLDSDLEALDEAASLLSPTLPFAVEAPCPTCLYKNAIAIDVSSWLDKLDMDLIGDVHVIASTYGWAEADILTMSQTRRNGYLRLIEQSRGLATSGGY